MVLKLDHYREVRLLQTRVRNYEQEELGRRSVLPRYAHKPKPFRRSLLPKLGG
jgi:hypothetical protein